MKTKIVIIVDDGKIYKPTIVNSFAELVETKYFISQQVADIVIEVFVWCPTAELHIITVSTYRNELEYCCEGLVRCYCDEKFLPDIQEWVTERGYYFICDH